MVIRTLKDAKQFIDDFKKYSCLDPNDGRYKFQFKDFNLSGHYPNGITKMILDEDNEYYQYSYGRNWMDQSESHVDNPVRYVWEHRKSINAELKTCNAIRLI